MIGEDIRFDSYRDPAGLVFKENGRVFRAIRPSYEPHFAHIIRSGLAKTLLDDGILLPENHFPL